MNVSIVTIHENKKESETGYHVKVHISLMKKKKEREKEREKSILRLTQQCNIFSRTKGTPVVKNEEKLQQDYKKKTLLKLFFFFFLSLSLQ